MTHDELVFAIKELARLTVSGEINANSKKAFELIGYELLEIWSLFERCEMRAIVDITDTDIDRMSGLVGMEESDALRLGLDFLRKACERYQI